MKISTGDVLLVSSSNWLGEKIQDFQKCKWNHAGIFLIIENELYLCDAQKHGIRLIRFKEYKTSSRLMILRPKRKVHRKKLVHFILPYVGNTPYDFVSLVLYQPIRFLFGKWIGRKNKEANKRFTCSEWVAYIYKDVFPEWWKAAPVDLFNSEFFEKEILK